MTVTAQTWTLISKSLALYDTVQIQGWIQGWGRDDRIPPGGGKGKRKCEYEGNYSRWKKAQEVPWGRNAHGRLSKGDA